MDELIIKALENIKSELDEVGDCSPVVTVSRKNLVELTSLGFAVKIKREIEELSGIHPTVTVTRKNLVELLDFVESAYKGGN